MAKSKHTTNPPGEEPDSAIFALAKECAAAAKMVDEAMIAFDQADRRCRYIANPPVIIRTEKDKQLGLYVGNRAGSAYGDADVPALRALVRACVIVDNRSRVEESQAWERASEILAALRDLKDEEAREGFDSGLTEAKRSFHQAQDAFDELAERLAKMAAATMEGAFAKARVMRRAFLAEGADFGERFTDNLCQHMRKLGPDDEAFAMSLARDLIQLAAV